VEPEGRAIVVMCRCGLGNFPAGDDRLSHTQCRTFTRAIWAQYYGPPSNARCVTVVAMISLLKNKQPLPLRLGDGAEATRANELRALWDCLFR